MVVEELGWDQALWCTVLIAYILIKIVVPLLDKGSFNFFAPTMKMQPAFAESTNEVMSLLTRLQEFMFGSSHSEPEMFAYPTQIG